MPNTSSGFLKINCVKIESWASCCTGSKKEQQRQQLQLQQLQQQNRMEVEETEMGNCHPPLREPFIFGSWKKRNGRRAAAKAATTSGLRQEASCLRRSDASSTKRKRSDPKLPQSQRSSAYRPAFYAPSFSNLDGGRAAEDRLQGDDFSREDSEELDEDYFFCPRCGNRMIEPRLLDCLHPICASCVEEILDQAPGSSCVSSPRISYRCKGTSHNFEEGCPICDHPLPQPGSPVPPPHYPLQHRLLMHVVRHRLSDRFLCCDVCPEEVHATVHCPTCLGNFCSSCGVEHEEVQLRSRFRSVSHQVRPLWEAKKFRRTALCLEHPSHTLRFHCVTCQRVTCRECMWRGAHRGHVSEGASRAGRRATGVLVAALERARCLLNSLLTQYDERSFSVDDRVSRTPTAYYYYYYYYYYYFKNRDFEEWPETKWDGRSSPTLSSYAREAQERIDEYERLQKARYLLDAVSLGEELVAEGSDVEILSLSRVVLKRLRFLGLDFGDESNVYEASDEFQAFRTKHSGVFHCCSFCSSGGKKEATCACGGTMPGGYRGCGHGHPGHPRVPHWSCCGSTDRHGSCLLLPKPQYKVTL